jgi:hypothetical protein
MKSFKEHLLESLSRVKLDAMQLFNLFTDNIDYKAFALNSRITDKDAKNIQEILKTENLFIISVDQMYSKYDKEYVDKIVDKVDELEKLGPRYGSQLGLSDEEKKQREEAEKALAAENGEEPKEKSDADDSDLVEQCCTDFVGRDPQSIVEYFWKKGEDQAYLFFVVENTPEIEDLLEQI